MDRKPFIDTNVEVCTIHSSICNQDFLLSVKLPLSYRHTDKIYPALYCLDANRGFHLFSDISLLYETPGTGSAQEIIIAGIGYVLDEDYMRAFAQWLAWRAHDLTPVRNPEREQFYAGL